MNPSLVRPEIATRDKEELVKAIESLKKDKNAVVLAHYYQVKEIQEIADFIGDSLELSRKAAQVSADIILFAGVRFMAETAKILNPGRKVLLPDLNASCSLAESCPPESFAAFKERHPEHVVVSYINCSAEIKAMSDVICTSSNALKVINSIPKDKPIIFAPDKNLGEYLIKQTGRDMLLWDGACIVHEAFAVDKILRLHHAHPEAKFIAHPESKQEILEIASYVGSTSGMINFVKTDESKEFIVATEAGLLYQMQKAVPDKLLWPAPAVEDNSCNCSECHYMKMNTLEKVYYALINEFPEVKVDTPLREKALAPIEKMMEII